MEHIWGIGLIGLCFWNIVVFILFGIDKRKAVKKKWRIPEATLLLCSVLGGGMGGLMGMLCFRHKTKHTIFNIIVPASCLVSFVALVYVYMQYSN